MSQIEHVHARQILDSRGNPTVEVELSLRVGGVGARRGPVGRIDGRVRGDRAARRRLRLAGQGRHAGRSTTSTARSRPRSAAWTPRSQAALDRMLITLDGTPNKSRLGANAILAVSLAAAQASAAEERQPLWRYLGGETRARAAGADDERAQRRRARRQQARLPGVHDRPGRGAHLRRGAADGLRGLPPPEAVAARPGPVDRRRRRGRVRARPGVQRGRRSRR